MYQMFGGDTKGGIFDIPMKLVGQAEDADMVVLGVPIATPYQSVAPDIGGRGELVATRLTATIMGMVSRQRSGTA